MSAKDLIDRIDKQKIIEIMSELGAEVTKETEEYLIFDESICHRGSSKNKLYYYLNSKNFRCWTNCGNMNIFDMVMKVKGYSFSEAYKYLNGRVSKYAPIIGFYDEKKFRLDEIEVEELPSIDKPFLYKMFSNEIIDSWADEGISKCAMNKFKIKYDKANNRAIIPHFNSNDETVGIRVRNFNDNGYAKYMPLFYDNKCYSHALGKNLYGLNVSKENIKRKGICIVFEGEKSVLKYESYYPNENISVAICGSNFSNVQKKMLLELGVKEVILALDKQFESEDSDEARDWRNKILKNSKSLTEFCKVSYLWDSKGLLEYKDSPVDKGKKTLERLINNKLVIN